MGDFWKPVRELTRDDVEWLKTSGDREKTTLDYKRFDKSPGKPLLDSKGIAEDLMAFANSVGGRLVLGGIEENEALKDLQGVPAIKVRDVFSTVRNIAHLVQPPVQVDTKEIELADGSFVFVVDVPSGQIGPFQVQGVYKQRVSSGNVPMLSTAVENAILAAHPVRGREDRESFSRIHVGKLNLADSPPDTPRKVWACGIEVLPATRQPRNLYKAIDPRVQDVVRRLRERDYDSVKPTLETLFATRAATDKLEMSPTGSMVAITYTDAAEYGEQISILDVNQYIERMIVDCGTCLDVLQPNFLVTISVRLWGVVEPKGLRVTWPDRGRDKKIVIKTSLGAIAMEELYTARELAQPGRIPTDVAGQFCEYLKLHVTNG